MSGILIQSSSGLIFVESCETYANGWTFAQSGSTASASSTTPGHSGAAAFKILTGKSWAASAYGKLTKTQNLLTGANRVLRGFRGPLSTTAWPAPTVYDAFSGSVIDTGLWTKGGAPTESSGQAHLNNSSDSIQSNALTINLPMKIGARFQVNGTSSSTLWYAAKWDYLHYIVLQFNYRAAASLSIFFANGGGGEEVRLEIGRAHV
jgi:hypothetical protein